MMTGKWNPSASLMDKTHTLNDVLSRWQNDLEFRNALKKAQNTADFKTVLATADIHLADDELKKIEAMLKLKEQTAMNIDLDKKINK